MAKTKWSNPIFLDDLRRRGDVLADTCVARLRASGSRGDFRDLFRSMDSNDDPLPDDLPPALQQFFAATRRPPRIEPDETRYPHGFDLERVRRGGRVFLGHALPSALVLLTKSLPEGYAAPALSRILCLSRNLTHHPFRRLTGVLQLLVYVSAGEGFTPGGRAFVLAQKMRLLHAGIRRIAYEHLPGYQVRYGVPVNLEDMLATMMGFSLLQIEGLRRLHVPLSRDEEEDLYYLWRVFAQMCGIYPEGERDNPEFIPEDLDEAREFYRSYARRHYVDAGENPDGVELAAANLEMMDRLLPQTPLRRLGWKIVPRVYVQDLIGVEGCRRVGIRTVRGFWLLRPLLLRLPALWAQVFGELDRVDPSGSLHERISRYFFGRLIDRSGDQVSLLLPDDIADLREMVEDPGPGRPA